MDCLFKSDVKIPAGDVLLAGELFIPLDPKGIIVFSHGSGSSRLSPKNRQVALYLQDEGFGTLLFDLLTPQEDYNYNNRFLISLLKERLTSATEWVHRFAVQWNIPIAYFGASTGAAAALKAAAYLPEIAAVVCRGGRPDLVLQEVKLVKAPTLLIVGSLDTQVIDFNKEAYNELRYKKKMIIVDGASHLFEEKEGTLEQVCQLASVWFKEACAVQHKNF
jgi:putative phosphoribosyl transferase